MIVQPILRPYQRDAIERLREGFRAGHQRQILCMPTGAGKTAVAVQLVRNVRAKGGTACMVVDRIELALQAADAMRDAGLRVSLLQGDNTDLVPGHDVIVASVQTLAQRRATHMPIPPHLVLVDEAHVMHRTHQALFEAWPEAPVIGMSATPYAVGLGRWYSNLVSPITMRELVDQGFLVPLTPFGPSSPNLLGVQSRHGDYVTAQIEERMSSRQIHADIVSTWRQLGEGRSTLAFCCSVAHAKAVAASFVAAGVDAAPVDGYMDLGERRRVIHRFKNGALRVLTSVSTLTTGVDIPRASCGIVARPTRSTALHVQMLGRLMRPYPDKQDALILDHAGNIERHGLPQDIAVGELDPATMTWTSRTPMERLPQPCPACKRMKPARQRVCPACGFAPERQPDVATVAGTLAPIRGKAAAEHRRKTYQEFVGLARAWQKKPGWAFYLYQLRFGKAPGSTWRNLPPLQPSPETLRFVQAERIRYVKSREYAA